MRVTSMHLIIAVMGIGAIYLYKTKMGQEAPAPPPNPTANPTGGSRDGKSSEFDDILQQINGIVGGVASIFQSTAKTN